MAGRHGALTAPLPVRKMTGIACSVRTITLLPTTAVPALSYGAPTPRQRARSALRTSIQRVVRFPAVIQNSLCSTLFFAANDGISGRELWSTDGSALRNCLLIYLPVATVRCRSNSPLHLRGCILWHRTAMMTSSGAVTAPRRVPNLSCKPTQASMIAVGDGVYFQHNDGSSGTELWRLRIRSSWLWI